MIQKEIGKNTLGSGKKMTVDLKTYNRSTHDQSYVWRNTMSVGTLVPFMKKVALPGDITDIDLEAKVLTHPTVGPLYGSYKLQLDIFTCPIRLYISALHNNSLKVGLQMNKVKLPKLKMKLKQEWATAYKEWGQINPSSLLSCLGINGFGIMTTSEDTTATYNGVPTLAYWDIFKNYYANKQEENAYYIGSKFENGVEYFSGANQINIYPISYPIEIDWISIPWQDGKVKKYWKVQTKEGIKMSETDKSKILLYMNAEKEIKTWQQIEDQFKSKQPTVEAVFNDTELGFIDTEDNFDAAGNNLAAVWGIDIELTNRELDIISFPLSNIDDMREDILQKPFYEEFDINETTQAPYGDLLKANTEAPYTSYSQYGLALKTYQSDIFNNWINTEWIEGAGSINELTAVSTADGEFTIDALNIAQKVYNMLNRIALSDGTYRSWLETVYTNEYVSRCESPIYEGGLSQEIIFDEVISTSANINTEEPLGTIAGKGALLNNKKGGKIRIKVDEPSYIIGIVSITPRIDYSQGNDWDCTLDSIDDLHKPELDAIGFQDLPASWMAWSEAKWDENGTMTERSFGKQPAWVQYMTEFNKTKGNFAVNNSEAFMVLNRNYEINYEGEIQDATTYIDPTKYNYVFADTNLDAMNFWVQIGINDTSRRKMSAKIIPNL